MSEQVTRVEAFDPDVALYLISQQLFETDAELWAERFRNAAFGNYQALEGGSPSDTSEYEKALLNQTKDFACEQIELLRKRNLAVFVLDPATASWYEITGVGYNTELLSLVAQVHDPLDPGSVVTKLLGPSTELAYSNTTTEDTADWQPGFSVDPIQNFHQPTIASIGQLPFADIFPSPLDLNQ